MIAHFAVSVKPAPPGFGKKQKIAAVFKLTAAIPFEKARRKPPGPGGAL
jgi:hypothetical protein